MSTKLTTNLIVALVLLGCFAALLWWFSYDPVADFSESVPGMDNRPAVISGTQDNAVQIGAIFSSFDAGPADIAGEWPRFRGSDFDNISKEKVRLANSWSENGPRKLWSVELGEGHAGPVVSQGRVYLLDYDEDNRRDLLRCFALDSGEEIWQRGYDIFIKRNHGMSRTVPAVANNRVVTIGPMCQTMCVTADSGRYLWGIDIAEQYQSEIPLWYTGQCPLVVDSLVILATGGTQLLVAVSLETGEVVWQTPNPDNWKMSHSSVMPMTIAGKELFVYSAIGGIVAVSARGDDVGQVVFKSSAWDHNVIAPSPVYLGDNRIFVTAGYGGGSMLLEVKNQEGEFRVEVVQELKPNEGLASEQQTPILFKDRLFSILPKDAGPLRNQFVCVDPDDCSRIIWSSGKTNRFGLGPYLLADNKFFILSDDGILTMSEASTDAFKPLAQARILNGHDAWGPLALVNGLMLARDSRHMVCIDLKTSR